MNSVESQNRDVQSQKHCNCSHCILAVAGGLFAIATLLGALEAHALPSVLTPRALHIFDIGVRYQFYNTLGLFAIGLTANFVDSRLVRWAAWLVVAGIFLFSGSIYWLAVGAPMIIGIATPLGGLSLIVAWILYSIGVARS